MLYLAGLLVLLTVAAQAYHSISTVQQKERPSKAAPLYGPDPCLQSPVYKSGNTRYRFSHFFYHNERNRCYPYAAEERIVGNVNKFDSREECENRCKITNKDCLVSGSQSIDFGPRHGLDYHGPDYHGPRKDYHGPDYHGPRKDYHGPDYHGPRKDYHGPDYHGPDYHGPRKDYHGPDYHGPRKDYHGPDYHGPRKDYHGPRKDYHGPRKDYHGPDYHGPRKDYHGPDYHGPRHGLDYYGPDYHGPRKDYHGPDYHGPRQDYHGPDYHGPYHGPASKNYHGPYHGPASKDYGVGCKRGSLVLGRYYYEPATRTCDPALLCSGNPNQFRSKGECEGQCLN